MNKKKGWIAMIFVVLLIIGIAAIYPKWNEIWYDFGRNLYNLFNS